MFNLLKPSPMLQDENLRYMIATYKWLLKHFGGDDFYKHTNLVLPTEAFFPEAADDPTEIANTTFRYVKKYANMEDWHCELVAQDSDPDYQVGPATIIQGGDHSPAGTFSTGNQGRVVITYNPSIVSDPSQLVATLAHELAHYLTGTCKDPPPGGWENWEYATDIAAVFMGFGIFCANSAFSFSQFSDVDVIGWNTSRSGYLSEQEYAFALGIFLKLKGINVSTISKFLDLNIKSYVKKSLNELRQTEIINELSMAN